MLPDPYAFPAGPHERRHGPRGLKSPEYKAWLRDEFQFRCAYCLHRERWEKDGWRKFQIDHVLPRATHPERIDDYDNLVYSCASCNWTKGTRLIPDPCSAAYGELIRFEPDGTVIPLNPEGGAASITWASAYPTSCDSAGNG